MRRWPQQQGSTSALEHWCKRHAGPGWAAAAVARCSVYAGACKRRPPPAALAPPCSCSGGGATPWAIDTCGSVWRLPRLPACLVCHVCCAVPQQAVAQVSLARCVGHRMPGGHFCTSVCAMHDTQRGTSSRSPHRAGCAGACKTACLLSGRGLRPCPHTAHRPGAHAVLEPVAPTAGALPAFETKAAGPACQHLFNPAAQPPCCPVPDPACITALAAADEVRHPLRAHASQHPDHVACSRPRAPATSLCLCASLAAAFLMCWLSFHVMRATQFSCEKKNDGKRWAARCATAVKD